MTNRNRALSILGACALATSLWVSPAHADATAEIKAAARDLAVEGINLAKANRCTEALEKLERAEKLYHAPTILTWVGECQIKVGRLVDGTESLNQVVRENIPDDAPDAFREAQSKAATLLAAAQPKIARLTVDVVPADAPDLQVIVNGRPMPLAMVGAPRPTDPGNVEITVKAKGYLTKTINVRLTEAQRASESVQLEVDTNAPTASPAQPPAATPAEAQPSPSPAQPASTTPPATNSVAASETSSGGNTLTTIGWITVGTGAAALIGGGVFGGLALGDKGSLVCPQNVCSTTESQSLLDSAHTKATISTVLFIAGGVLATTGVTLLVWPKDGGGEKSVALTPNSIRFTTTF